MRRWLQISFGWKFRLSHRASVQFGKIYITHVQIREREWEKESVSGVAAWIQQCVNVINRNWELFNLGPKIAQKVHLVKWY